VRWVRKKKIIKHLFNFFPLFTPSDRPPNRHIKKIHNIIYHRDDVIIIIIIIPVRGGEHALLTPVTPQGCGNHPVPPVCLGTLVTRSWIRSLDAACVRHGPTGSPLVLCPDSVIPEKPDIVFGRFLIMIWG